MRIAVIGASGRLGSAVAREALARSHSVTAISRDPARLETEHGLAAATAATADITDPTSIARAVANHDAVVTAIKGDGEPPVRIITQAARNLLVALPEVGVSRLVFLGGGASLTDPTGTPISETSWFPEEFRDEARDQAEALEVLRAADTEIEWSYASPSVVYLPDGPNSGAYRAEARDSLIIGEDGSASVVTTGDYAAAIVDTVVSGSFIRERFAVGS